MFLLWELCPLMSFVYIQRGQANCFEALLGTFGCSLLVIRPGWDGSIIGKFDYLIWKMYTHSVGPLVHLLEPYWIYNWLWIPARKWLEDLKRLRKITWWYVFFSALLHGWPLAAGLCLHCLDASHGALADAEEWIAGLKMGDAGIYQMACNFGGSMGKWWVTSGFWGSIFFGQSQFWILCGFGGRLSLFLEKPRD